jgi:hypothetical protein
MEQLQSHIWPTASPYLGKFLRISSYIRQPFPIYDFATVPLWISLNMRKIFFSFLSVHTKSLLCLHSQDRWSQQKNHIHKSITDIKKRPNWHRTPAVCRPRQVGREFRVSRQLPEVFISSSLNKEDHYVLKMAVLYKGPITYREIYSLLV